MGAKLHHKKVSLMTRQEQLSHLDHDDVVISTHEHLDREELFFENVSISYEQDFSKFASLFKDVKLRDDSFNPNTVAAAFFSCPVYERFRAVDLGTDLREGIDIYRDLNNRLLEEIGCLHHVFKESAETPMADNLKFLPLPFLFVDPNQTAIEFERRYKNVFNHVAGLKWHPFAQRSVPKDYVGKGFIDLAAAHGLPTVIHSERPGEPGDLSALLRDVSPVADRVKAAVDLAHLGFLHDDLKRIQDFEYTYSDISPWSAVFSGAHPESTKEAKIEALATILSDHKNKVLFGLDTPFNWLLWSNGDSFGADVVDEIVLIKEATQIAGVDIQKRLFNTNPRHFLAGKPSGMG